MARRVSNGYGKTYENIIDKQRYNESLWHKKTALNSILIIIDFRIYR